MNCTLFTSCLAAVATAAAVTATASASLTTALSADADTYTRDGRNAGADANLDVRGFGGGDFVAYIRFDLSGLDTITDAALVLHETRGSRNDGISNERHRLYGLTDSAGNTPQNWDESVDLAPGVEFTSVGGAGVDPSVLFVLDPEQGANVTETVPGADLVDVTTSGPDLVTFLNDRFLNGGLATFIVTIDSTNRGYGFASRENTDAAIRPRLELTYVPEPATAALLGLGGLAMLRRRSA